MHTYNNLDYLKFNSEQPLVTLGKETRASGNFKYRYDHHEGIVYHGHNKTQRYSHELQAQHLETWRGYGMSDYSIIDSLLARGARFTRIDIAITCEGNLMPEFLENISGFSGALAEQKHVKSINDELSGNTETVYIGDRGNRSKKGVFRAYRHDLKHGGENMLTRFELECGKNNAHGAARKIENGTSLGACVGSYLQNEIWQLWQDITSGDIHTPLRGKSASDDTLEKQIKQRDWLIDTCAPVLGRAIAEDMLQYEKSATWDEFKSAMQAAFADYIRTHNG